MFYASLTKSPVWTSVQCLSLLWTSTRTYRTCWTWSAIWRQRQRTLPERWGGFSRCGLCYAVFSPDPLPRWNVDFPLDGGGAEEAAETESDLDAELLPQPGSTGGPQPGCQTDPGSGDKEAGTPEPGLWKADHVSEPNSTLMLCSDLLCNLPFDYLLTAKRAELWLPFKTFKYILLAKISILGKKHRCKRWLIIFGWERNPSLSKRASGDKGMCSAQVEPYLSRAC